MFNVSCLCSITRSGVPVLTAVIRNEKLANEDECDSLYGLPVFLEKTPLILDPRAQLFLLRMLDEIPRNTAVGMTGLWGRE